LAFSGHALYIGLHPFSFLMQIVCFLIQFVTFPYPQCHLGKSMFPVATLRENIFRRKSRGSNGVRHRFRDVRALHFEILHYFLVEGLTSAAASGIGACAATLLLPASD